MSFRHSQRVFQYCKTYLAPGLFQPCQHLSSADRSHVTGYAMERGFIYPGPWSMERAQGKRASGKQEMFAYSVSWGAFGHCSKLH